MKRRTSTIAVAGFEYLPEGQLLSQFVDFDHAMAAAYERCIGYTKDFHTHDRINLTFPRSASVIKFTTREPSATFVVDDTRFLWMPADVVHRQDTESVIYDNLAIFPDDSVVETALKNFRLRYGKKVRPPAVTLMRKRTPLLDTLLSSYFAERILERKSARVLQSLTHQIFDEVLRILFCPRKALSAPQEADDSAALRAVKFIEANLFSKIDSRAISDFSRVSMPTLFRKFKATTGMTPHHYIFRRRMDEAFSLLKRGEHTVGDVAVLVGYEDIAAFSKAFTAHFKRNPSSLRRDSKVRQPVF